MGGDVLIAGELDGQQEEVTRWFQREAVEVRWFGEGQQLLEKIDPSRQDVVILDLESERSDPIELLKEIHSIHATCPCFFWATRETIALGLEAIRAGGCDVFLKPLIEDIFVPRIVEARRRQGEYCKRCKENAETRARLLKLTPREREVLDCVVDGKLTKQIARQLDISSKTVDVHRSNIRKKFDVNSVAELVRIVVQERLLRESDFAIGANSNCLRVVNVDCPVGSSRG